MGDLLSNSELFRKLGLDSSNQWILYDEQFERFFNFISENITDANILTEQELLERDEMVRNGGWLDKPECELALRRIDAENPGLLKHKPQNVTALSSEIAVLEGAAHEYAVLIDDMQNTKRIITNNLNNLEYEITKMQNEGRGLLASSQTRAKQLEDLQRENCKLSIEAKKGFTSQQSPPVFMHQQPLEQYFLKNDSFVQYFNLYLKENFKIQDNQDFQNSLVDNMEVANSNLEVLQNSLEFYTIAIIKKKIKARATQSLIDHLDFAHIQCLSLSDMMRETHDLQLLNNIHLKNTYDTLYNSMAGQVHQLMQQRIELVLLENTKQKLERANQRRENNIQLTTIISHALSNAELAWIAIQLDLEKSRNCLDSSEQFTLQAQASWQRVQDMRTLWTSQEHGICAQFLQEISCQLANHLGHQPNSVRSNDVKSCLYEYEKFGRLLVYALQSMLNKKSYILAQDQINELKRVEEILRPFVYDSPLKNHPMFENVVYLCPIFNIQQQEEYLDGKLRKLRTQYNEDMKKDTLLRYSNILWIWFLTEPQRMLHAIDEVKKAAASTAPSLQRTRGGLQRK
ncbi:augmin complex subunit dgt3 [Drosophila tropicalis]|uniref:augmin complex subunit dgt3 n=1 Tax=Drosophila tropicalis TaxID=46794 RepID=UPI0035AC0FCF